MRLALLLLASMACCYSMGVSRPMARSIPVNGVSIVETWVSHSGPHSNTGMEPPCSPDTYIPASLRPSESMSNTMPVG